MDIATLRLLTDEALIQSLHGVNALERRAVADVVAHLAEMDRRSLHLELGFRSLFEYCCESLHLTEHAAYDRIAVARLARRLPHLLDLLANGTIHLTAARLLAPHLTPENHERLLVEAAHKRKWQVEEMVARLAPQPDVRARIRSLPSPAMVVDGTPVVDGASTIPGGLLPAPASSPAARAIGNHKEGAPSGERLRPAPASRARPTPLAADRYEFRFTAGRETRDKFREAQDLLRHAVPNGDMGEIIDRALTLLVADALRRKCAATAKARKSSAPPAGSRTVPAAVRRVVWARDGGRCRFVGAEGRRCTGATLIEFHHVKPWAVGGAPTVENIELRCRCHNRLESERYFAASHEGRDLPQCDARERGWRRTRIGSQAPAMI